jgi:hypothetical protein
MIKINKHTIEPPPKDYTGLIAWDLETVSGCLLCIEGRLMGVCPEYRLLEYEEFAQWADIAGIYRYQHFGDIWAVHKDNPKVAKLLMTVALGKIG